MLGISTRSDGPTDGTLARPRTFACRATPPVLNLHTYSGLSADDHSASDTILLDRLAPLDDRTEQPRRLKSTEYGLLDAYNQSVFETHLSRRWLNFLTGHGYGSAQQYDFVFTGPPVPVTARVHAHNTPETHGTNPLFRRVCEPGGRRGADGVQVLG
eukprot:141139-Pyramimonas_sp.AAC.1